MPDLSRVLAGYSQVGGLVWDPLGKRLLFSADGALKSLNPLTGAVTSTAIPGAHRLGDLDLAPDGRFVLVSETQAQHPPVGPNGLQDGNGTGYYYRVWLTDGHVETLSFPLENTYESGSSDIAVASNLTALLATDFAGSGTTNVRAFSSGASTPIVQDLAGAGLSQPELFVSDSHRYVLIAGGGISSGPLAMYDASAGRITAQAYMAQVAGHQAVNFITVAAISDAAGLVAVGDRDGELIITDLSLHVVKDLSFDFDARAQGLAFSRDGRELLLMERGKNQIAVFDTTTWKQLGVLQIQSTAPTDTISHGGTMTLSDDGHFLFVETTTGVEVVDLSANLLRAGEGSLAIPRTMVTDPVRVAPGETINHVGVAYHLDNPNTTGAVTVLDIAGTVNASVGGGPGVAAGAIVQNGSDNQLFLIEKSGAVQVHATGSTADAWGYWVQSFHGLSFENRGLLDVSSLHGSAFGVNSYALSGSYTNSGAVHVSAREYAVGFALVNLQTPSAFRNSGTVEVHDDGGQFGSSIGVSLNSVSSSFHNEVGGAIVVGHTAPGTVQDVGVLIESNGAFRPLLNALSNAGLIQGEVALKFTEQNFPGYVGYGLTFHNEATGVLKGAVILAGAGIALDNAGLVDGPITMGDYSELYDGSRGGRVSGMVSGGAGDDIMLGGPGFDYFEGNTGNDSERGADGDDWVVGGKGNDTLYGESGADIVYGNIGDDSCDGGGGNDLVRGGQGDDVIRGGAGDDWLSGDRGNDTAYGGQGADVFHSFSGAGIDRVMDFNAAEGDRVQLDPGTTYTVYQVAADTVVDMGNGDQLILVGVQLSALPAGWIFIF